MVKTYHGNEPEHEERHVIIHNMNTESTEENTNNPDAIMTEVIDNNIEQTPEDSKRRNEFPAESHAEIDEIELLTTLNIRSEDAATVTEEKEGNPEKEVDDEKVNQMHGYLLTPWEVDGPPNFSK